MWRVSQSIEDGSKSATWESRVLDCAKAVLKGRHKIESIEQVVVHILSGRNLGTFYICFNWRI
jgi:hypothetical protein